MVRAANAWSKRDIAIAAAAVALQAYATRSGFGGPCALLLLIIAPFVFGRDAWDGETSAYSVFNGGRRIAGMFTAEQFDAQLRGGPRPDDNAEAVTVPGLSGIAIAGAVGFTLAIGIYPQWVLSVAEDILAFA